MFLSKKSRDESGFTLVELVITVLIVGVIVIALGGMMISYFKANNATLSRLSETTDQQLTSAYWQQDVSSFGLREKPTDGGTNTLVAQQSVWTTGAAPSDVPAGCKNLTGVVIGFAWNDFNPANPAATAWDATPNAAVYTAQQIGADGQYELTRVRCIGATTRSTVIAHRLTGPPDPTCKDKNDGDVSCTDYSPNLPAIMTLTMVVADKSNGSSDGYTARLTAQRRQG